MAAPAISATKDEVRFALAMLLAATAVLLATGWAPEAGRKIWLMEVSPALAGIAVMAATFRRFPLSRWLYGCALLHLCVLAYGGHHTYALAPLGE